MLRAIVVLILLMLSSSAVRAGKRVALVIGNSSYQHVGDLANPKNDATDMTAALRLYGFQVIDGLDLNKAALDRKVLDFAAALQGAEVAVVFYAGGTAYRFRGKITSCLLMRSSPPNTR
jgi:uncharacterized caspase-like protein